MENLPKYTKYNLISKLLIISGLTLITVLGLPPLVSAISMFMDNSCGNKYQCQQLNAIYQITSNNNVIRIAGVLAFQSQYTFGVYNEIEYKFVLTTNSPNLIKSVDFIIGSENDDFKEFENLTIEELKTRAKEKKRLIDMQIEGNKLLREALWVWPIEEKLVLMPYVTLQDGNPIRMPKSVVVADLKSFSEFKQAESNYLTNFTNLTLLGLSWAGIGAIPLVVGADILLRINLRESEVDKWFIDKSQFDLDPI